MVAQSIRDRRGFTLLDQLSGKNDIGKITDELIAIGAIDASPDSIRNWLLAQGRAMVGRHRLSKARANDIKNQWINLIETHHDGTKVSYYRKCNETTPGEAIQHIKDLDRKIARRKAVRDLFCSFYSEKHGKSKKFQKFLAFKDEPSPVASV